MTKNYGKLESFSFLYKRCATDFGKFGDRKKNLQNDQFFIFWRNENLIYEVSDRSDYVVRKQ